jgi:hypothetical protein
MDQKLQLNFHSCTVHLDIIKDFLTCQRLIFRLYRGAKTEKYDVIARATRTGCRHSHRYDNGNIAA